jgi:hypothetical protein
VDRFGAIPRPTAELMNTIRLRWLAKDLGFEKVVLKQQTFVAYFVQNQKSAYYQSESFSRLMQYLAKYPARARMKEKNNKLTLVMDQMRNIDMVVQSLILMKNSIQPENQVNQKKELFYTQASSELIQARINIAQYSFPKTHERLLKIKNIRESDILQLEEDKSIAGQKFVCVSFVSPEKVLKQKDMFYFEEFLKQWDFNKSMEKYIQFLNFLSFKYNMQFDDLTNDFKEFVKCSVRNQ